MLNKPQTNISASLSTQGRFFMLGNIQTANQSKYAGLKHGSILTKLEY